MVKLHIKLKGIKKCSKTVANILSIDILLPPPLPDPGDWVNRSISTFSEHTDVAYQIKGDHECSNMVANILPADRHPPDPGVGSKRQNSLFHNIAMLHIKLK